MNNIEQVAGVPLAPPATVEATPETTPLSSTHITSVPIPEPPPPTMPHNFNFAKNGLKVAGSFAFCMSLVSYGLGVRAVSKEREAPGSINMLGVVFMFVGRLLFLAAIPIVTKYESRVGLIAVGLISMLQCIIAMFALQFFSWDHLVNIAFIFMVIFAFWFANRMNEFCKLNSDTSLGPKKHAIGVYGHDEDVSVTSTG